MEKLDMAMTNQQNDQNRQLKPIEPNSIAETSGLFSDTRIALIRNSTAKGAPEDVFVAMIELAKVNNLNPLAKQIMVVNYKSKNQDNWQVVIPIDGYRSIADQSQQYAGSDAPIFTMSDRQTSWKKDIPESATITVWKLVNGERYPFSETVYWDEYDAGRNNWVSMPRTMLAKVAESHALRKAFPARLSGTYTPEEMDQASVEVQGRVVTVQTGEIEAPRQTRQDRPRATKAAEPVSVDIDSTQAPLYSESDEWQHASRKLHAIANNVIGSAQAHVALHIMAELKGVSSLKELPAETLLKMAEFLDGDPEKVDDYWTKWIAPRLDQSGEEGDA